MSCCCTRVLNLCNQNICGDVEFDSVASMPGVYKLAASFLNTEVVIEAEFAVSDALVFPLSELNENYEYTVEILDPLGDKVIISSDGLDYDCFKFKTVLQKTLIALEVES